MPVVRCPYFDTCAYETADVAVTVAVALLNIHNNSHVAAPNNTTQARQRAPKIERPKITRGSSEESWNSFTTRWTLFKRGTTLSNDETVQQLFQCCDDDLGDAVLKSSPDAVYGTEDVLLAAIKQLSVTPVAISVRQADLLTCRQDHGENVRSFFAKLRGKAATCAFSVTCSSNTCNHITEFTDSIVKMVLVAGLVDEEIKREVLGWAELDAKDINATVKFIEAKEMARDALGQKPANAGLSLYKKSKSATAQLPSKVKTHCKDCKIEIEKYVWNKRLKKTIECSLCLQCWQKANPKHSKPVKKDDTKVDETSTLTIATENNLAENGTCSLIIGALTNSHPPEYSGNDAHYSFKQGARENGKEGAVDKRTGCIHEVLKDENMADSAINEQQPPIESAAVQHSSLYVGQSQTKEIVLDHHIFQSHEGWKRAESMAHPTLRLRLTTDKQDYKHFGGLCPEVSPSWVTAVTDTGAQSCLWSLHDFYRCGFKDNDLIPVRRSMVAANSEEIKIVGAIFMRLSGTDANGVTYTAAVMVYISPSTKKLYLPREALIQLKVIPKDFPKVGAVLDVSAIETKAPCGCPTRALPPDRPAQLPFKACPENIPKMKEWLSERYAASTFNKCPHQQLKGVSGPPLELHIDGSVPHRPAHTPAMIPLHYQEEAKRQLDEDEALGVIEKVPYGEKSKYCFRAMVTAKPNSGPERTFDAPSDAPLRRNIRRVIDMSQLNKATIRETHHVQPPFQQARSIPPNTWKTVTDAWNGYHSIPLRTEDIPKTTFITQWGRYRYKMAPQGCSASGDGYTRRFDEIIADIPRKTKCVDDTAQWDTGLEEHWWSVIKFLERCGKNGIILNLKKLQFCQREIEFAGFLITDTDVKPLDKYLKAIAEYPTPTKTTDIRAWFGLVNQVSHYAQLTKMMEPFRPFLSKYKRFEWTVELNYAFEQSKLAIVKAIQEGVRIYDIKRPTCLRLDWSNTGIGYFLSQKHCDCNSSTSGCCENGWRITLAGSRFLKPAESRYAPVEGEALAVKWALEDTKFFTQGSDNLVVVTDHKPLLQLFQDRALDQIANPRLFSLKQATLPWKFSMVHRSGEDNHFADATSRNPASGDNNDEVDEITDSEILAAIMIHEDDDIDEMCDEVLGLHDKNVRAITWDMVKEETSKDEIMYKLMALINSTFPVDRCEMLPELLLFWNVRNNLYILDGVILMNDCVVVPSNLRDTVTSYQHQTSNIRIVVPQNLRSEVISTLHSAHQGISGMNERAKAGVFWPGITNDIQKARNNCNRCNNIMPSQARTPPIEPHIPTTPFESIACDYFHFIGHYYFIAADRLSGWLELQQVKVGTNEAGAEGLCKALRRLMVTFGVPIEISSDGGPEFKADETTDFLKRWGIRHRLSSAYHPSSNGRAELAVKAGKRLLMDNIGPSGDLNNDCVVRALLTYRNTPEPGCKLSPAQILLGRPLRDTLPYISKDIMVFNNTDVHPQWREAWSAKEEALKTRYTKSLEALKEHSRPLPPLRQGDPVIVQNQTGRFPKKWDKSGVIVESKSNDQYVVKMAGSGRLTLRNRRFLRKHSSSSTSASAQFPAQVPTLMSTSPTVLTPIQDWYPSSTPTQVLEPTTLVPLTYQAEFPRHTTPVGEPQSSPRPPSTPVMPSHTSTARQQLTFGEFDMPSIVNQVQDDVSPVVEHTRSLRRNRHPRKIYDASTGHFKEPYAVPENI